MSYIIILEKFKEIGKYHIILAIITHLTLYLSFYTILFTQLCPCTSATYTFVLKPG